MFFMGNNVDLYEVEKDVICIKCGNKGAVKSYGKFYPNGVKELADSIPSYESYRDKPHLSYSMGFGGTIPHSCLNCDNTGLIGYGGLEGYDQAFNRIEKEDK